MLRFRFSKFEIGINTYKDVWVFGFVFEDIMGSVVGTFGLGIFGFYIRLGNPIPFDHNLEGFK